MYMEKNNSSVKHLETDMKTGIWKKWKPFMDFGNIVI